MILFCYLAAVCVKDIGSVISIAGATVNPFIGFLFPIIFYIRLDYLYRKEPLTFCGKCERLFAVTVGILILTISIVGFANLFAE